MTAFPAILKSIKFFLFMLLTMVIEFILPIFPAIVVITYLIIVDRIKALQHLDKNKIEYSNSKSRRRLLRKWFEYIGVVVFTHYLGTYYFPSIQILYLDEFFRNYPFILYGLVTLEIISTEIESIAHHHSKLEEANSHWIRLHEFTKIPSNFISKIVDKLKSSKIK